MAADHHDHAHHHAHHHGHSHDHAHDPHEHRPAPVQVSPLSLLRLSLGQRLIFVAVLLALLWAAVFAVLWGAA